MGNAGSCLVGSRMRFHTGCRRGGEGRPIDQNIGLATFVCSSDLSCKVQLGKFHKFHERKFNILQRNF